MNRPLESLPSVLIAVSLCGLHITAFAQDKFDLHPTLTGRVYQDNKITVRIPKTWAITLESTGENQLITLGVTLRKGRYVLRLCTGCAQASGIVGGRFGEIAAMVQPWYRDDRAGSPCGKPELTKISTLLDRVDFWYQRDVRHPFDSDANDCHEPRATATVWYGTYFAEHCHLDEVDRDCGGYFLHKHWLTDNRSLGTPFEEMAFAMTYETTDLDQLPRKDDPNLTRVLREASAIVRSIHYRRMP